MISSELISAIAEIQQPRSRFQLEHFVVNQHDTEEMRYYQILVEINDLLYKYRLADINYKKTLIEIERLRATGDAIDELNAQEKEMGLEQSSLAMIGAQRELTHLINMWQACPTKFTREQIELAEPKYWQSRLSRQAELQALGQGRVDWAQLDAIRQAGFLQDFVQKRESVEIEQPNKSAGDIE